MTKYMNRDPSSKSSNIRKRLTRTAAIVMAAIALNGCVGGPRKNASKANRAAPSTLSLPENYAPTTSSPEQLHEALKEQTQTTAESLAKRIIDNYNNNSVEHWLYEPGDGFIAVNLLPQAETKVPGAYGEYGMIATMSRDPNGDLDPASVDTIAIFENVNVAGKERAENPGDRLNIYGFSMFKDKNTGEWSIFVDYANAYSTNTHFTYNTDPLSNQPIDLNLFETLANQAKTVFEYGLKRVPVDYVPQIPG